MYLPARTVAHSVLESSYSYRKALRKAAMTVAHSVLESSYSRFSIPWMVSITVAHSVLESSYSEPLIHSSTGMTVAHSVLESSNLGVGAIDAGRRDVLKPPLLNILKLPIKCCS